MADTITATAQQGEVVDALVFRILGQTAGAVEKVLSLNRGIADAGAFLTEGQVVILPNLTAKAVPVNEIIQLWG